MTLTLLGSNFPTALPSAVVVPPSGDTTGVADVANINAALAASPEVWLSGAYYQNSTLLVPSNRTLIFADATLTLVAGTAHGNQITNSTVAGSNSNIKILGFGNSRIIGNGTAGNFNSHVDYRWIGVLLSNVTNWELAGLSFTLQQDWSWSAQNTTHGYVHDLDFVGAPNAGQPLGGNQDLVLERFRGYTIGVGVCFEACSTTGSSNDNAYAVDGVGAGEIRDIFISDLALTSGGSGSVVWLINGRGSYIHRVKIDNCRRVFNGNAVNPFGGPSEAGHVLLGSTTAYEGVKALFTEMTDIEIANCALSVQIQQACSEIRISDIDLRQFNTGTDGSAEATAFFNQLVAVAGGSGVNVKNVTIDGAHITGAFTSGSSLLSSDSGSTVDQVTLRNVHATIKINYLLSNAGTVTNLDISNIHLIKLAGALSNSSVQETGSIKDVVVDAYDTSVKNSSASTLRWGWNMPELTSADTTPAMTDGSIVRCDSTKVLDGGSATEAVYMTGGSAWTRIVSPT